MFFQRLPVTSLEELLFTDTHTNFAVMSAIIELVKRLITVFQQLEIYLFYEVVALPLKMWCSFLPSLLQWHHSLEILDVSSNSGINDDSMELLRTFGMPKLQSLNLASTNIAGDGVR